jgi:spore coat polysaccharide biosynthesis protein SpsF (cytidylyltransferase family)
VVFSWDGDENDVAGRFAACLEKYPTDRFFRICADSPLLDWRLIEAAKVLYEPPYVCLRSSVGCVELVETTEFLKSLTDATTEEREHVTKTMHRHCLIKEMNMARDDCRFVVDTIEDFTRVEKVVARMTRSHWQYTWQEVCALASSDAA